MKPNTPPRDYQIPIIEKALQHKEGVLAMSVGSGKTYTFLNIISQLGLTATILVPNTVLQNQVVNECKKFFDYEPGVINGKTKEIRGVTVSTFQSLFNNPELLSELVEHTSVLVVDEVHQAVTDKRLAVVESFNPTYLYSCSGSLEREDGKTDAIFFHFGEKIADFHLKQLSPMVQVHIPDCDIEADEYHRMIEQMVENESRNTLVAGCAIGEAFEGRKVLVLTKRREHARRLHAKFGGAILIDSDDPDRNEKLAAMKRGDMEFSCIIGTTSLLAVGMDIPSLDTLVLACDMKSRVLTTQSVGRILRLFEGKESPKIIDFLDGYGRGLDGKWKVLNPILYNQFRERFRLYQAKGWEVKNLEDWQKEKFIRGK